MREQDTVRAPGLGQVGVEEGQGDKDPEVGLSGGQRACAAGPGGQRGSWQALSPSDHLDQSLGKSRSREGKDRPSATQLVAELQPEHKCPDPIPGRRVKGSHNVIPTAASKTHLCDRPTQPCEELALFLVPECGSLSQPTAYHLCSFLPWASFVFWGPSMETQIRC